MVLIRAIITILLLILCRITVFKNEITLRFSADAVDFRIFKNHFKLKKENSHITSIAAKFQKNLLMEGGIDSIRIKDRKSERYTYDSDCFYVFGRCFLGNMLKSTYPVLYNSYGDWTMNGTVSEAVEIYNSSLPEDVEINIEMFGRGAQDLIFTLSNGDSIQANIVDGYMDNAVSLCINGTCPQNSYNHESTGLNLKRISNFFFESFLAGYLIYWLIALLSLFSKPKHSPTIPAKYVMPIIVVISLIHLSLSLFFAIRILASTPHISDSAIYYRQALLLSHGLTKTAPMPSKPYAAYLSNSSEVDGDRIVYKHANRFWPALLAIPMKFGVAEYLNPFLSTISLLLIFYLASTLFSSAVGLIAAFVFAISPYSIINSGDFMMHSAAQSLFLGGVAAMIYGLKKGRAIFILSAGLMIAYAFAIRQLTVLALSPALIFLLATFYKELKINKIVYFFIGASIIALIFILDNYYLTGEWFLVAHKKFHNLEIKAGNLNLGANSVDANLASLTQILFGLYVPQIFLGLITYPLIKSNNLRSWLLYLFFVSLAGAHLFVSVHGLHGYGPRFLYESFFSLAILTALGVTYMYAEMGTVGRIILSAFFAFCLYQNTVLASEILPKYRPYNGVDPKFVREVKALAKPKSIILIKGDSWQGMDQFVTLFDPTFKERLIIREQQDNSHQEILDKFPDWPVFYVDFMKVKQIRP